MDLTHGVAHRETATHVYFVGGPFSQWARSPFNARLPLFKGATGEHGLYPGNTLRFNTAEQYMMASKASVFGDGLNLNLIMATDDPREQKQLGRKVQNFDVDVWNRFARDIVFIGNWAKFDQNDEFAEALDRTDTRTIVEGAHYDPVWGVKLAWDDPLIEDEANWAGTNWLEHVCMAVRDLRKRDPKADPWLNIPTWP